MVVWGASWRPDQKDVSSREAAAEQGLKDYLARSSCFPGATLRRATTGESLTAEHATRLATGSDSTFGRVIVIAVRELGPIVKLLSSAALVDGANEVVLNIGVIKGPMDSPVIADFAGNLDRINDAFPPPDAVPSPTPIRFNDECPAV